MKAKTEWWPGHPKCALESLPQHKHQHNARLTLKPKQTNKQTKTESKTLALESFSREYPVEDAMCCNLERTKRKAGGGGEAVEKGGGTPTAKTTKKENKRKTTIILGSKFSKRLKNMGGRKGRKWNLSARLETSVRRNKNQTLQEASIGVNQRPFN